MVVVLPPLRERREDIPVLTTAFLERYFRRRGENPPEIADAVTQSFMRYWWPGNVRELEAETPDARLPAESWDCV